MQHAEDLPTDIATIEREAVEFVDDLGVLNATDAIMILGQLDATEIDLKTGQPRWTDSQRALILEASEKLAGWKE